VKPVASSRLARTAALAAAVALSWAYAFEWAWASGRIGWLASTGLRGAALVTVLGITDVLLLVPYIAACALLWWVATAKGVRYAAVAWWLMATSVLFKAIELLEWRTSFESTLGLWPANVAFVLAWAFTLFAIAVAAEPSSGHRMGARTHRWVLGGAVAMTLLGSLASTDTAPAPWSSIGALGRVVFAPVQHVIERMLFSVMDLSAGSTSQSAVVPSLVGVLALGFFWYMALRVTALLLIGRRGTDVSDASYADSPVT